MAAKPQKSRSWYVKYPGDAYALGPLHFDHPVGRMAVRERSKEWSKLDKLPRGFECWPAVSPWTSISNALS